MFWQRLYEICLKRGCRPNTVATAVGLSTATATKWKNGATPNGEALKKIADYLNCSVDYLLGRESGADEGDDAAAAMFARLKPEFQDIVLNQIRQLLELQIAEQDEK